MTSSRMVANCARRSRKSNCGLGVEVEFSADFAGVDISLAPVIIVRQAGDWRRDSEQHSGQADGSQVQEKPKSTARNGRATRTLMQPEVICGNRWRGPG